MFILTNKYLKPDSVQDPHFAWFCLFPFTLLEPGHPKRIYTIALFTSVPSMHAKNHLHIQCELHHRINVIAYISKQPIDNSINN